MHILIFYGVLIALLWWVVPILWNKYKEYQALKEFNKNVDNATIVSKAVNLKVESNRLLKDAKDKNENG